MRCIKKCGESIKTTNAKGRSYFEVEGVGDVFAAGFMLRNGSKYLVQCHDDQAYRYSDFGGKTEPFDKNIYDTVMREVCEESNGYLNVTEKELMAAEKYYSKSSKYLLFIIDTVKDYCEVIKLMGNCEDFDDKPRTTGWFSPESCSCHPRVRGYFVLRMI